MDNVVQFTGPTLYELDPSSILEAAIDKHLDTVAIVGVYSNGELYFAGSTGELERVLMLLKRAENQIYRMVDEIVEDN